MASNITTSFVKQFSSNIHDLLEREGSQLMGTVDVESVTGKQAFFERLGSLTANQITSRHADTNLQDPDHSRRMLSLKDYEAAIMFDKQDDIRMLIDPTSNYARKLANAHGRIMDDTILSALAGTAATGEDGSGSQALPAGQQIAAGGTALTVEKLIQAKRIMLANNHLGTGMTAVISPKGLEDLLAETEVQSADYNSVKALVRGDVDTFMGFRFLVSTSPELVTSGSVEKGLFYAPEALKFGKGMEMSVSVDRRPDKNNNLQILTLSSFGAVRMEEELVVEVSYAV